MATTASATAWIPSRRETPNPMTPRGYTGAEGRTSKTDNIVIDNHSGGLKQPPLFYATNKPDALPPVYFYFD
jgi:hypothetical protein